MDSLTRPVPSAPAIPEASQNVAVAEAPPGALARLGRLIPGVDALVRFAYRTAAVSAAAVLAILAAVLDAVGWADASYGAAAVLGVALLLPAGAAALAGWTLADAVSIPGQLREAALQATGRASGARERKGSRLLAVVRSIWAARGLALLSKGTWLKGIGALRFVRLASLPFALGLLGLFALNAVVIAGGLVALLVLLF